MRAEGRGRRAGLWAVALLALSSSSPAQTRVPALRPRPSILPPALRRALAASATLRYAGRRVVTVLKDGQPERHEEVVLRDGPRLRIEFPNGGFYGGQVIVEDGKVRRHFLPSANEVRVLPARNEEGLQRLRTLAKTGRVTATPGETLAGYPTVDIAVRDALGNLVQRLAIEPNSGIVLRRIVYDATGAQTGGFVFTKIDPSPGPFDASLFRITRKGAKVTTPWDQLDRVARRSGYAAVGLPAATGFRLDAVNLRPLPEGPVLVQRYVGPGGMLSLFQLRAAVSPERLRKQGRGLLNVRSWVDDGVTFVLLGPQDAATLARLQGAVGRDP